MHAQEWVPIEVRLSHEGKVEHQHLDRILITEETHRIRNQQAEAATNRFALRHPLPERAAAGGRHGADPQSEEELQLSRGPF